MKPTKSQTTEECEQNIGDALKAARLKKNLDQKNLALIAGIGVASLARLEQGLGSTLSTLIKATRALGLLHWIQTLDSASGFDPMELLKRKPARQRASRLKKNKVKLNEKD